MGSKIFFIRDIAFLRNNAIRNFDNPALQEYARTCADLPESRLWLRQQKIRARS
jgi:hypothetical protein